MLASQAIKAGDAEVVVAGGQESMSSAPHYVYGMRGGIKAGNQTMVDGMIHDGLWDSFGCCHMGEYAEYTAQKAGVSREDQDAFAFDSHRKAIAAMEAGKFKAEIIPVQVPGKSGPTTVAGDEAPRKDTSAESLAQAQAGLQEGRRHGHGGQRAGPQRRRERARGDVAGLRQGARSRADGAGHRLRDRRRRAAGDLLRAGARGPEPDGEDRAPRIRDYDLIEANEAFAVQALADGRELGWDWDRVNVNGGAVALGHPIGASGARVLTTLLYALRDRGGSTGLATLCLGGGNAVALSVELV